MSATDLLSLRLQEFVDASYRFFQDEPGEWQDDKSRRQGPEYTSASRRKDSIK
jgi:hypothetical protein